MWFHLAEMPQVIQPVVFAFSPFDTGLRHTEVSEEVSLACYESVQQCESPENKKYVPIVPTYFKEINTSNDFLTLLVMNVFSLAEFGFIMTLRT